ncbi:unnamed protein product [Blepharisma stoltei]|uniref:Uncharacterized protein n=1 Tax=Blepharisma stoltei TaxID=1481888 RepID=A0AAU9IF31_9CILI|nr:unnamed protein product [Blepharisma stoltei]
MDFYEIPGDDSFSLIKEKGFELIKPCGDGNEGLSLAIVYSLMEMLVQSQGSYASGLQFVESAVSKYNERKSGESLVAGFLSKIKQGSASLKGLWKKKPDSDFYIELRGFSNFLLNPNTPNARLEGSLNSLSKTLNLDIRIYQIDDTTERYCENSYCYPRIINLLKEEIEDGEHFSILYHKSFEEAFQLSEPFVSCDKSLKETESDYIVHLKNIAGDLIQSLSPAQLKVLRNVVGPDAQRLLNSEFSWGFEGKLNEIQQKK